MFTTLKNAWKTPELRKKILFTLFVLLLYRLGNAVPVPYVNVAALSVVFSQQLQNTILGLYDLMSGSAFSNATVFALGIQPYINASIIIELLCIAIPALERLQKEGGEEGRKKINEITRYTTVGLGLLMGFAYFVMLKNYGILEDTSVLAGLVIVLSFAAGASLVMWMGEQITEFGIGNGISMILFANIIARLPSMFGGVVRNAINKVISWPGAVLFFIGMLALIVFIVFVTDAERRIPVQYAKRVVGRKMYGGQSSHLPIKVNMSGVLPIIFAQSICSLPATICTFIGKTSGWWYTNVFNSNTVVYAVSYFLLIIAFSYFYATVQYNPVELSNNIKNQGGFIPGFRPGRPTAEFIAKVISKVTLFGAMYLAVVALLPIIIGDFFPNAGVSLGGTSIIIVVGVALETVQVLESQLLMRHYKGFLD